MKKASRLMLIGILCIMLMPVSSAIGEQKESGIVILMFLQEVTNDGYFIYNVTNLKNETIQSATILLDVQGGGIFHKQTHVITSVTIENLTGPLHSKLYKTHDKIFTRLQYPLFGRPLIATCLVKETYNGQTATCLIHIMFRFISENIKPS